MVTALAVLPPSIDALRPPTIPLGPVVRCAADLAVAYDRGVAAYWRGETDGKRNGTWLEGFWRPIVLVPLGPPAAMSVYGGAGRGIAWYDADDVVVGCVRGCATGGYWVPRGAPLPGGAR
jgi:hypothetical protein